MDTTVDHFTPLALRVRGNYVNCVHVTLTYTSSNCILPALGYAAKVTRLFSKRVWLVRD